MERTYLTKRISAAAIIDAPDKVDELKGYMILYDGGGLDNLARALNILDSKGWKVLEAVMRAGIDDIYVTAYYPK